MHRLEIIHKSIVRSASAFIMIVAVVPAYGDDSLDIAKRSIAVCERAKSTLALTAELIRSLPDRDVSHFINCWLVDHGYFVSDEASLTKFMTLSPGLRAMYTTTHVEGEVDNGGFNQYYYNSNGVDASDAVSGLQLIGATCHSRVVSEANALFKNEYERFKKLHNDGSMEAFMDSYEDDPFDKFDKQFYACHKKIDLEQLRIRYIRTHLTEFIWPPQI